MRHFIGKNTHSGHFTPRPGEREEMHCDLCGSKCNVERNVHGPTGMAEAMAKHGHLHDVFICPYSLVDWHQQARGLEWELRDTSSPSVKALIQSDIDVLLKENLG